MAGRLDAAHISGLPVARGRVGAFSRTTLSSAFQAVLKGVTPRGIPSPTVSPALHSRRAGSSEVDKIIHDASARAGLDEGLVRSVVQQESGFRSDAVSKAGAMGLMQLMPSTARSLGVKDPFDPVANVAGGVKYLKGMLDRFGSVPLALAAYNAGPAAVEKFGGVPPYEETQRYVSTIMRAQNANELAAARPKEGSGNNGRPTA